MKTFFCSLTILVSFTVFAQQQNPESRIEVAISENNFFRVRSLLEQYKETLSNEKSLFYRALTANSFDQCRLSNEYITKLLKQNKKHLADSFIVKAMDVRISNSLRLYEYKTAVNTCETILKKYYHVLDSAAIKNYENMRALFGGLAAVPPQEMYVSQDVTISAYRNKFNHLMVPVKAHDTAADFIFDSGAGLSTVSESYADKMKMKIIESKVDVSSGTTITVKSKLAVADSIYVGDILFRNVVFLMMPDSALSFTQVNLVIKGIIGFPVLYQMGEIHMFKDGKILVPKDPVRGFFSNLFLDNQVPVVAVVHRGDTLLLNLDTGAKETELSKKFYESNRAEVDSGGKKATKHFGSAGGIAAMDVFDIPNFKIKIGSQNTILPHVTVMTQVKKFTQNRDGNLGQDVIRQFDEMILSFKYMYVDFKNINM